ncbi:MAG: hypothetical protein QM344_02625 [Bacillota bacterium]|nr:hypothetical protein [Bacillota bacterium]
MRVACNEGCAKEFKIKSLNSRRLKDDIDQIYFTCPHCKREYIAYYLSSKVKDLQAEQRKLMAENNRAEVESMKRKIKAEMDRVRAEIETGNTKM